MSGYTWGSTGPGGFDVSGLLTTAAQPARMFSRPLTEDEAQAYRAAEAAKRAEERAATVHVALTFDSLFAKLGWPREYAEHFVQPYCTCGDGYDGWEFCQHVYDLGIETSP